MRAMNSLRKLLWAFVLIPFSAVANDYCSGYVTESAKRVGDLRLCQSRTSGGQEIYACLVFHAGNQHYQALFKGGVTPRLIEKDIVGLASTDDAPQVVWQKPDDKELELCTLTPPSQIPDSARHQGTGVCLDNAGSSVPCSIYERELVNRNAIQRFFVYYHPWGEGITDIDVSLQHGTEINQDTGNTLFLATLTRLMGEGLKHSACCAKQGQAYLEFAESLLVSALD